MMTRMISISGSPMGPKSARRPIANSLAPPLAAIALILALTAAAPAGLVPPQFATRVTQVEVYATVTGSDGRAVKDLGRDDFEVFEDGEPQKITAFFAGEFPASVALAI